MPPKSPTRTVLAEEALSERVRLEREQRGWSPAGLAGRMTKAGCPMTQSAIWKIENGEPRRRITLDEAVTFAKVFDLDLDELTLPPKVLAAERSADAVRAVNDGFKIVDDTLNRIGGELRVMAENLAEYADSGIVRAAIIRAISVQEEDPWWGASREERIARAHREGGDPDEADAWFGQVLEALDALRPYTKVRGMEASDGQHPEA